MGHNGCDRSQASGPWAIGSGYRFTASIFYFFQLLDICALRWEYCSALALVQDIY